MLEFFSAYWPHITVVFSIVVGVPAAIHAAMTKDDVRAAIGWVGVILLSPVLGAFFYLVAGINRIRQTAVSRRRARADARDGRGPGPRDHVDVVPWSAPQFASLKRLGDHVSVFPLAAGNRVEPLDGGDETYPAMLAAIRAAERSIAVQSYIFDNDPVGQEFAAALVEARQRGVEVRVLIDGVGSRYSRPPIVRSLAEGGITTARFMNQLIGLKLPYANLRSHRKVMVVDGRIGFTGGMNIRAEFSRRFAGEAVARDHHFRFEGPIVGQLMSCFAHDWYFTTQEQLTGPAWDAAAAAAEAGVPARVVPSGPDRNLGNTHSMIMGALAVAQHSVRLCSPYFIPDQQLIGALSVAARRGLEVDIVIPSTNNLRLVDHAMTAQLDQVIRHGCRVWRAAGAFDHSKLLVVDGAWAYVGSSNLDARSLRLNFELDVEIYDRTTARWIEERIAAQVAGARRETLSSLRARPFLERLRNRAIWLASPYL